jgi:hypothetical protein
MTTRQAQSRHVNGVNNLNKSDAYIAKTPDYNRASPASFTPHYPAVRSVKIEPAIYMIGARGLDPRMNLRRDRDTSRNVSVYKL